MFSFTSEELKLSGDVGFYGYPDREWWLGFKLRSPVPGLFSWYLRKPQILALSYFRKRQLGVGKNSCHQPRKNAFLAPHCCRKKGTNPLVLTGNKEKLAKPLWDKEGIFFQFYPEIDLTHLYIHYQLLYIWLWVSYFSLYLSFLICKMTLIIVPKWLP